MPDFILPPHSPEAERGVLGALLQAAASEADWEIAIGLAQQRLPCDEAGHAGGQFYIRQHGQIYKTIIEIDAENRRPDLITLIGRLRDSGLLEDAGGISFISQLPDTSASPANIGYYLDDVYSKWQLRRLIQTAGKHLERASSATDAIEAITDFQSDVLALDEDSGNSEITDMKELLPLVMDVIEKSIEHRNQGLPVGLQSGWSFFNKRMMGFLPRQVTIFGGEPGVGKTSCVLNLAIHLGIKCQVAVGILSAESGKEELGMRMLCIAAGVNGKKVHSGFTSESDLRALVQAAGRLTKAPIFINDHQGMTPRDIKVYSRRLIKRHGCRIIILDHIHECYAPEARNDPKLEGKLLMSACRWVARNFNVPVVVLGQLNREAQREMAKSTRRRPMKSDLRDSGFLEQMADNICILYRDRQAEQEQDEEKEESAREIQDETWLVNIEVAKQRNGPTGLVEMTFHRPTFRFFDRYADRGSVEAGLRKAAEAEESQMAMEAID